MSENGGVNVQDGLNLKLKMKKLSQERYDLKTFIDKLKIKSEKDDPIEYKDNFLNEIINNKNMELNTLKNSISNILIDPSEEFEVLAEK